MLTNHEFATVKAMVVLCIRHRRSNDLPSIVRLEIFLQAIPMYRSLLMASRAHDGDPFPSTCHQMMLALQSLRLYLLARCIRQGLLSSAMFY